MVYLDMAFNQYNHSNWYPEYQPKPDFKPSNKYATWIWLGIAVAIVGPILLYVVLSSAGPKIRCALADCRNNSVGQPLSWTDQLSLGKSAALKKDQLAILKSVFAEPFATWPQNWTVSDTLKLSLVYVSPTLGQFTVIYDDATANGHTQVDPESPDETALSARQEFQSAQSFGTSSDKYDNDITAVFVSPREAEIATWPQAVEEAMNDRVDISPVILLEFGEEAGDNPPIWIVDYWPVSKENPPNSLDVIFRGFGGEYSSEFKVDATSGKIISMDQGPMLTDRDR